MHLKSITPLPTINSSTTQCFFFMQNTHNLTNRLSVTAVVRGAHIPIVRLCQRQPGPHSTRSAPASRRDRPPRHRHRHCLKAVAAAAVISTDQNNLLVAAVGQQHRAGRQNPYTGNALAQEIPMRVAEDGGRGIRELNLLWRLTNRPPSSRTNSRHNDNHKHEKRRKNKKTYTYRL